jgi:hypothetical protein
VKTRTIASSRPAAFAKRCISSKLKTRIDLGFFLRSRIVGSDADALEGVEVADFIRDRVLGHRREGAEGADGPGGCSTFGPQHVIDQGERVAAAAAR